MTLVVSWIRRTPAGEEMVVASDSRLTGGILLNHAPKLFRLERQDAVIAYCGPTIVAYPLLLQVKASLDAHEETRSRILDIVHLKSHIEKVIESLRSKVADLPSQDGTNKAFKFMLAGYSWKLSEFKMWTFRYDVRTGDFNAHAHRSSSGDFIFMSDVARNEARAVAALTRLVKQEQNGSLKKLDWQPLQILLNVIRDVGTPDIGGPPQVLKIYRHANTMPLNVIWPIDVSVRGGPAKKYEITHLGRPLLGYERSRNLSLDPDTCQLLEPWNVQAHLDQLNIGEEKRELSKLLQRLCSAIAATRNARGRAEKLNILVASNAKFPQIKEMLDRIIKEPFDSWYFS